jgi:hypothetical protein
MRVLWRSIKATLIAIPALVLLFVVLFPPHSTRELGETMGWMVLATLFLGLPLFIVILLFNAIFNRSPRGEPVPQNGSASRDRDDAHARRLALIGAVLAGTAAAFIHGIIWEVWLIFAGIGALLGFIAGKVRR